MKPDEDIPPAAVCAQCGQPDCEGACTSARPEPMVEVPWERELSAAALWRTCVYLAEPPERWLSKVHQARLGRALGFALLVEICAVGSYVLPVGGLAALTLYSFDLPPSLLGSVGGWLGACLGMGSFMVALHVLWAVFVEGFLALSGAQPWWRRGLLLACYSCAWDLLTSPAGVGAGWSMGKRPAVARLLAQALKNPRTTSLRYLTRERGQSLSRAGTLAGSAALLTIVCGLTIGGAALWWFVLMAWHPAQTPW